MHAKKNAHTGRRIALITILVLLALAVLLGGCALRDARRLLSSVDAVEESVLGMIDAAKAMNMDGVEAAALSLQSVVREDEEILDGALWRMAARMPGVGGDVRSARKLIGIARQGVEETLLPALSAMRIFKSFRAVVVCAGALSVVCFCAGLIASYLLSTPVGASVVLCNLLVFLLCCLAGRR